MDEVTQQNAALVEQAAAAAESMKDQAQALTHAVSTFKLAGTHSTSSTVKRNNRPATVTNLPNRGPAVKKALVSLNKETASETTPARKTAAGGSNDWEEF